MTSHRYSNDVFINCPFDDQYHSIFRAIVFCVFDCGFRPRCALEVDDSSQVRIDKILKIISESKYGIHDISRTELDHETGLPRFNMPFELGLFVAAQRFGSGIQRKKNCLILDRQPYRYQQFLSDIAGQDIRSHENEEKKAITMIRNWLSTSSRRKTIPGGAAIHKRYREFVCRMPEICQQLQWKEDELTFTDYAELVSRWLRTGS
ncbi:MAG: hypothetical protein KDA86_08200 [Planctomycetaceae bacterium]|nr:hypothetical protein [Planctomycetaceae bacterium]MCA9112211.1 hypothetical protein [Planctomycetaceae bacterium]